jgi:hypothetical protein
VDLADGDKTWRNTSILIIVTFTGENVDVLLILRRNTFYFNQMS